LRYLLLLAEKRKDYCFMSELSETGYILQMARAVVEELEPEELGLFPLMAEAYVQSPESLLTRRAAGEVEPGMGAGERIAPWTPTILLLLHQAALQGGKGITTAETKTRWTRVLGRVRGLWRAKSKKQVATLPAWGQELSRENMQTLHTFFYEMALEYGVKDAKARQIAECVVGKWATRPVTEGGQR
jgi:hypothetical protein